MNVSFFQYLIDNQILFKEQYKVQQKHRLNMRRLTKWKYVTRFRNKLSRPELERKIRAESNANDTEIRLFLHHYA